MFMCCRIEKVQNSEIDFIHTVQRAHLRWNPDSDQPGMTAVIAQRIINDMMQEICPKVSVILGKNEKQHLETAKNGGVDQNSLLLEPSVSVQKAAEVMAAAGKTAVLGVSQTTSSQQFGIFTTKDLLSKVVAKGLDPNDVKLEAVMTKNPDTVEADSSLLDALQ